MPNNIYEENQERDLLGPVGNRANPESVMTDITQKSVSESLIRLTEHYSNTDCTIETIIEYLENRKKHYDWISPKDLEQVRKTLIQIRNIKEIQGNSKKLKYITKSLDIAKSPYLVTELTPNKIDDLISFIRSKKKLAKSLPLCFFAAQDEHQIVEHISVEQRIELFFLRIHDRKTTCQPHTLGVEGLQGSHPLVPNIIDREAIKGILLDCYNRAVKEYLAESILSEQLNTIKSWYERNDDGLSIFDEDISKLIFKKTWEKISEVSSLTGVIPDTAPKTIESFFFAIPPFLAWFENCMTIFDQAQCEDFWDKRGETLEEHHKQLLAKTDSILLELLRPNITIPNNYSLTDEAYKLIINKGKEKGIIWFRLGSKKLTFKAYTFLFEEIIQTIINQENEERKKEEAEDLPEEEAHKKYLRIAQDIQLLLKPSEEKSHLTLAMAIRRFKRNETEEALRLLATLGNARQVMFWLLHQLFNKNKSHSAQDLEQIIIQFHWVSGVNLNDCYGILEKIKNKGSEDLGRALLPMENVFPLDFPDEANIELRLLSSVIVSMVTGILGSMFLVATSGSVVLTMHSLLFISLLAIVGLLSLPIIIYSSLFIVERLKKGQIARTEIALTNASNLTIVFSPLKQFIASWTDAVFGYKTKQQLINDLTMPIEGVRHILFGWVAMFGALPQGYHEGFKVGRNNFIHSLLLVVQGLLQLVTLPLLYTIKIPIRLISTLFVNTQAPQAPKMARRALEELRKQESKNDESGSLLTKPSSNARFFTQANQLHQQAKTEKFSNTEEKNQWKQVKHAFFYSADKPLNDVACNYFQCVGQVREKTVPPQLGM